MASLFENCNAVKSAADAIDAAIVAKGGTTAGGLRAAPDAIAALPSGPADPGFIVIETDVATSIWMTKVGTQVIKPVKLLTSTDAVNWTAWDGSTKSLPAGTALYIKADGINGRFASGTSVYCYLMVPTSSSVSGSIAALRGAIGPNDAPSTSFMFASLFRDSGLATAPELPYAAVPEYGYYEMFRGCGNLIEAPDLPAVGLDRYACAQMFYQCSALETPPVIAAEELADYCFQNMFYQCSALAHAPALPATRMMPNCYRGMFYGCSSLASAPVLHSTELASYCYYAMFGQTGITVAPDLPATVLASYCYQAMFEKCSRLATPPALPATTLATYCYSSMFTGCTSLVEGPYLPAKTMTSNCYASMFNGCTSLRRVKMDASSGNWGNSMFNGCTSLELVDFRGATGVPTLGNINNFSNCNDTYRIVVPDSLYSTWRAATNWSNASIVSHIVKASDYQG